MRLIFMAAIAYVVSNSAIASDEIKVLQASGEVECIPYSASFNPINAETIIDFNKKILSKISVLMTNKDGFQKKVIAKPYGSLYVFNGNYETAEIHFGKCKFDLSQKNKVKTKQDEALIVSIQSDKDRLNQIQSEIKLLREQMILDDARPIHASDREPMPSYTLGEINPIEKEVSSKDEISHTVPLSEDWDLIPLSGDLNPIKSWKVDSKSNIAMIELEKGRGYELISAKDKSKNNKYKGKFDGFHHVLLPVAGDDIVQLEIKDAKSKKFTFRFELKQRSHSDNSKEANKTSEGRFVVADQSKSMVVAMPINQENVVQKDLVPVLDTYKETLEVWKNIFGISKVVYEAPEIKLMPTTIQAKTFEDALSLISSDISKLGVKTYFYTSNNVVFVKGD